MTANLLLDETEEKEKLIKDLKKMYAIGDNFSHIVIVLISLLPENKFTTSSWIISFLSKIGINIEKSNLTPVLNKLKKKEPYRKIVKGKLVIDKATPYLDSRIIDWDDPECIKDLIDDNENTSNKSKRDRSGVWLSKEGIVKVAEIRQFLRNR